MEKIYHWTSLDRAPKLATQHQLEYDYGTYKSKELLIQKILITNEGRKKRLPSHKIRRTKKRTELQHKINKLNDEIVEINEKIASCNGEEDKKIRDMFDKQVEAYIDIINKL